MTSITTWLRLEPQCRDADMNTGLQARVYDPLWLLARQWQIGEFQGEDNGSPAIAQWHGESARFTRYAPGALGDGAPVAGRPFDCADHPARNAGRVRAGAADGRPPSNGCARRPTAGRHFLRILGQQALSRDYADAVLEAFPLAPLRRRTPAHSIRTARRSCGRDGRRVPDGRALYEALGASLRPPPPQQAGAAAGAGHRACRRRGGEDGRERGCSGWTRCSPSRRRATRRGYPSEWSTASRWRRAPAADEGVLTAGEYYSGRLDWHDFDVNAGRVAAGHRRTAHDDLVRTSIPAPVAYRGMPASRFWEFEDARVDFGAVDAAPQDLARMLLVEFAITYGNDWFVMPIDLDVGALCTTRSLDRDEHVRRALPHPRRRADARRRRVVADVPALAHRPARRISVRRRQ